MLTNSLLSAALLAAGRPVSEAELCKVFGVDPAGVRQAVASLREALDKADLGLVVDEGAGGYRLVVAPGLVPSLADLLSPPPLPKRSEERRVGHESCGCRRRRLRTPRT